MESNGPPWTDLATAVTAIAALLLSFVSLFFSWKQHRLALAQEQRRKPALFLDYLEGYFSTDGTTRARTYHLRLGVRNPTDSDNALARVELAVRYRLGDGTKLTARIPMVTGETDEVLRAPQRIGAHETIAGWCRFTVDADLLAGRIVEAYAAEVTDSHGQLAEAIPLLLSERPDAR